MALKDYKKTKHSGLKLHKNGTEFLFDITLDGKRYRKTYKASETHTPADRLKTAYKALETFRDTTRHQNSITANLDATVNDYYDILKDRTKWNTASANGYNRIYDLYIRNTLGRKKLKDVKPAMFTQFNKSIDRLSLSRQKRCYELLSPIMKIAIEDEIIISNPIKSSHVPKRNQQAEKKVIIDATTKYKLLYKTINTLYNSTDVVPLGEGKTLQCSVDKPYLALFLLGFHGRRLTEVVTLQWDYIDFDNNQYRIKGEVSKVNQDMIFTLPMDVRDALLSFRDTTGDVFAVKQVNRRYKHIRIVSGLQEFTFHWMRNLAVSALSESGVATADLSAMLGHTDINTLNKYLSLQRSSATANTSSMSQKLLS